MQIAGIQKTTLVDYPGKVAATIFLRGCNFRCGFCHNPELVIPEEYAPLLSEEDLFRFLESRVGKLQGVCITGGEPLLYHDTDKLISHIKALGFAVKLDTNGSFEKRLKDIIKEGDVDYIAMDIKAPFHKYQMVTNQKINQNGQLQTADLHSKNNTSIKNAIQKSINLIMSSGIDYEFRTTVAKPYHLPSDFIEIGEMIKGAKRYYIQNFVKSKQINYQTKFEPFTENELHQALKNVKKFVINSNIR